MKEFLFSWENSSANFLSSGVNAKNIKELRTINQIDGFLIGGASQNSNKFIDIIKKTFN